MSNIKNHLEKVHIGLLIQSHHNINILKHNHLVGSGYTKLPKELDHPNKVSLIPKI